MELINSTMCSGTKAAEKIVDKLNVAPLHLYDSRADALILKLVFWCEIKNYNLFYLWKRV